MPPITNWKRSDEKPQEGSGYHRANNNWNYMSNEIFTALAFPVQTFTGNPLKVQTLKIPT